jgi:hypothetical protein
VLYVQEDFWPLNTALWVREFPKAEPLYAYYVLSSLDLKQFNSGAAVPTLNRNDIHGLDALIPPRALQRRFQEIGGAMLRQARVLQVQMQNLRGVRDLLLPRLLSGSIDISDAVTQNSRDVAVRMSDESVAETQERSDINTVVTKDLQLSETAFSAPTGVGMSLHRSAKEDRGSQLNLHYRLPLPIDQTDRSDVLAVIRQVFSDGRPRPREDAIRDVAHVLGYGRACPRIQEVLHTDLLTAVRRGILENAAGHLQLVFRSITDYDRDFLKQQFLAAIGRSWIERDQAIQNFCRWMGFRRTGPAIDDTARSLINDLLRENRIEADGPTVIRRSP